MKMSLKPKALIALYAYKPYANANTNVFLPLIRGLSKHFAIDIVTLNNDNLSPWFERDGDINIIRYKNQGRLINFFHHLYYTDLRKPGRSPLKRALVFLGKPLSTVMHIFPVFKHSEYNLLNKIIKRNQYDLIITTCESFLSCYHLMLIKKRRKLIAPWIVYFMDPFSTYIGNKGCIKYKKQEIEVYENCDLVMTTEEIYESNKENDFSIFLHKTIPTKFMNFNPSIFNDNDWNGFVKNKINCVFAGNIINESIRDPHYFLNMLNNCNSDSIVFHMICGSMNKNRMRNYSNFCTNKNVFWYSNLPFDLCGRIINNADILINISNKTSNQLPSKVFDYISTGLPIVNFYSIQNDVSMRYLNKYPLAINIYEGDKLSTNCEHFVSFILNNTGKRIPISDLKEIYKDYLSINVVNEDINTILSFVNNKNEKNK